MSIQVDKISKFYGQQQALKAVSFSINEGEVVGFLGPNGAGKSTMMKILTGFIAPSSGTATVGGINVEEDPIAVKQKIGYLPEHNPLYLDMYVKEYLEYVAGIYRVNNKKQAVEQVIEQVGLLPEFHKKIGALSKGYRQRVGLAQVLVHEPEVLILDEPTTGLDPNQIEEIRQLIIEVGKSKTVMMSTHIMQEVEAVCSRVLILDKGVLKADDAADKVRGRGLKQKVIIVEYSGAIDEKLIAEIRAVEAVKNVDGANTWQVMTAADSDVRNDLFQLAVSNEMTVLTLKEEQGSMEEVFKRLTSSK